MTKIGGPFLDTPANYFVYVLKFRMCEHDMPCAIEINSNGGPKSLCPEISYL